jgi:hypothetical protein
MKKIFFLIVILGVVKNGSAQSVGIGTNNPNASAQLDISSTSKGLLIPRMTTAQMNAIASPAPGLMVFNLTDSVFYVRKNSGWTKLIAPTAAGGGWTASGNNIYNSNTGNVGIGTTSPNASLSVARGAGTDGTAAFFGAENTSHFNYGLDEHTYIRGGRKDIYSEPRGSDVIINDIPGFNYRDGVPQQGGNILLANGGGNVGINTDYPAWAKLQINGSIGSAVAMFGADRFGVTVAADNPEIGLNYFYNNGTKTIKAGYGANFGMEPGTGNIYIGNFNGNQSASDFGSISGYQYCMYIKQNGNIGIGTTDPTYKLSVNGNVRSKEVVVESGWADYVFNNNYTLPTLEETEKFIQQHKHLPGIPSAKEIQSNGLAVGEVQAKMMAKIEELTLYVIELKKEINLLKKSY